MLYVLYRNSGCHTGRALRKMLSLLHTGEVSGGFPSKLGNQLRSKKDPEFIVNLGTTEAIKTSARVLNDREMVQTSSHKKKARARFAELGVPTPRFFPSAKSIAKECLPVVGRTSYHHKGQGFWFCKTIREAEAAVRAGATHFMEFIPGTREYRVHTFVKAQYLEIPRGERKPEHYASIKISEKVWTGEGEPDPNEPQKNHDFGWSFLAPDKNRRAEEMDVVRYAAKQAVATLGMDFGAADVMYRLRDKLPYVLEINSTPSMSDDHANTCEVYAKRILKTIGALKEDE